MTTVELWHNPLCSKSRAALALLQESGVAVEIRPYLDDPPSRTELESVLRKLGLDDPAGMMRKKEDAWQERRLDTADREARLAAILEEPRLIERPIAIRGDRAVIGRPPELVLELLG